MCHVSCVMCVMCVMCVSLPSFLPFYLLLSMVIIIHKKINTSLTCLVISCYIMGFTNYYGDNQEEVTTVAECIYDLPLDAPLRSCLQESHGNSNGKNSLLSKLLGYPTNRNAHAYNTHMLLIEACVSMDNLRVPVGKEVVLYRLIDKPADGEEVNYINQHLVYQPATTDKGYLENYRSPLVKDTVILEYTLKAGVPLLPTLYSSQQKALSPEEKEVLLPPNAVAHYMFDAANKTFTVHCCGCRCKTCIE